MKINDKITVTNEDNMKLMARYPDNYFDLAIVDPPYGIGESSKKRENTTSDKWKAPTKKVHNIKEWDNEAPSQKYFNELFRVSKNQIIWGGNYFIDKINNPSMGWIFWDKKNGDSDFSDGELAYTSFNKGLRKFEWLWNGFQKQSPENRIHPTQKPAALYKWILEKYSKPNFKIIDTHFGSGSIAIGFDEMLKYWNSQGLDIDGAELVACELDEEYFNASVKRIQNHISQLSLF